MYSYKEKKHITGRHQIILLTMTELGASGKMLNWKTRCKTISVLRWEHPYICTHIGTLLRIILPDLDASARLQRTNDFERISKCANTLK